jgi:hypothetical protein
MLCAHFGPAIINCYNDTADFGRPQETAMLGHFHAACDRWHVHSGRVAVSRFAVEGVVDEVEG